MFRDFHQPHKLILYNRQTKEHFDRKYLPFSMFHFLGQTIQCKRERHLSHLKPTHIRPPFDQPRMDNLNRKPYYLREV